MTYALSWAPFALFMAVVAIKPLRWMLSGLIEWDDGGRKVTVGGTTSIAVLGSFGALAYYGMIASGALGGATSAIGTPAAQSYDPPNAPTATAVMISDTSGYANSSAFVGSLDDSIQSAIYEFDSLRGTGWDLVTPDTQTTAADNILRSDTINLFSAADTYKVRVTHVGHEGGASNPSAVDTFVASASAFDSVSALVATTNWGTGAGQSEGHHIDSAHAGTPFSADFFGWNAPTQVIPCEDSISLPDFMSGMNCWLTTLENPAAGTGGDKIYWDQDGGNATWADPSEGDTVVIRTFLGYYHGAGGADHGFQAGAGTIPWYMRVHGTASPGCMYYGIVSDYGLSYQLDCLPQDSLWMLEIRFEIVSDTTFKTDIQIHSVNDLSTVRYDETDFICRVGYATACTQGETMLQGADSLWPMTRIDALVGNSFNDNQLATIGTTSTTEAVGDYILWTGFYVAQTNGGSRTLDHANDYWDGWIGPFISCAPAPFLCAN